MTCNHDPKVHASVYRYIGQEPGTALPANADGGYPLLYVDSDNCVLCAECASRASEYSACTVAVDTYLEGAPVCCEQCNAEIESAYGDPDAVEA